MTSVPPVHSLFEQQQKHLQVLLLLLKDELNAISARDIQALETNSTLKLQQLEMIQQVDQQIAVLPQLQQLKTESWFIDAVSHLDEILNQCKEQNEINRISLEQSQLVIERFKHELLQNRGKSGLTYTAKGKPSIQAVGKSVKA